MKQISRRHFLSLSAKGIGVAAISSGLMGCNIFNGNNDIKVDFSHGVASGDPTQSAIILWTRVSPEKEGNINVAWEVATDNQFTQLTHTGGMTTGADRDYTVKIDAINLTANTQYYYRFIANGTVSETGRAKTLPENNIESVKLAVMSCSNFPAGYFNVYDMAANVENLDAVLHLGDYIYEYPRDGYASEDAAALGREVLPANELLTLSDYRTRYAQYRSDASLQLLHARVPFITVWDDHEVANDTYKDGAENHNDGEGDFDVRKQAALQAYFEWLPIRPISDDDEETIYRHFYFGDLVDINMLDTRIIARDQSLDFANYIDATGTLDASQFTIDMQDTSRTMLGTDQRAWLQGQLASNTRTWQVLGQQVLMGEMYLPAAVALRLMSITDYAELGTLAQLAARAQASDPTLTSDEMAYVSANISRLTETVQAQLQLPAVPYNLDAWDGYSYEREVILQTAKAYQKNLIVLAGDTHNSWANELKDATTNEKVGVEFATSSVTSPGLENYLGIPIEQASAYEASVTGLVENLKYCNLVDRGFMTLTFTSTEAKAQWFFVDTIKDSQYNEQVTRRKTATVAVGTHTISIS
jgi:alkaline phosphatase D